MGGPLVTNSRVEEGLPLAWHLDTVREHGFAHVDCFWRSDCDAVFGLVSGHNPRSRRAFEKNGYTLHAGVSEPGPKSDVSWDLVITREAYGKL